MKRRIRITESDLHRIVKESVKRVLNEELEEGAIGNFFNRFRRSNDVNSAAPKGQNGRYNYSDKTGTYWYRDEEGNRHDTGVGYEKGRVGMNWNPFVSSGPRQVSDRDLATARMNLDRWHRRNADSFNRGDSRAEQEREIGTRRYDQYLDGLDDVEYNYERPHKTGFDIDQAGHTRAYFDDDADYDAGLR